MVPQIAENSGWVKELPEKIIYLRGVNNVLKPPQKEYVIFSPKQSGLPGGVLKCHKSSLYLRPDYNGSILAIDFIKTTNRGAGYGKSLLNFAKNLSKQIGCEGQIILKAVGKFTPMSVPHLFYRKNGFTTLDEEIDKKMDKYIKQNKRASTNEFLDMLMFYPDMEKKKSMTQKFSEKLKKYPQLFEQIFHKIFRFKIIDSKILHKKTV